MSALPAISDKPDQVTGQVRSLRGVVLRQTWFLLLFLILIVTSYVVGAAVMYFRLPTSDYLSRAFVGGTALHERGKPFEPSVSLPDKPLQPGLVLDVPEQTYDGFTLLTTTQFARAYLLDMKGKVVHQWDKPFDKVWPHAPHIKNQLTNDQVHWFTAHLYPNGDLLAVYQAENDSPYGYGLVKLDQNSNVVWKYANNTHHTIDVGEDGRIYTVVQRNLTEKPPGLDEIPSPYTTDFLTILSPDGKEQVSISILQAFLDSPYALLFHTLITERLKAHAMDPYGPMLLTPTGEQPADIPHRGPELSPDTIKPGMPLDLTRFAGARIQQTRDLVHANSAKVLAPSIARQFPLFKAGQVLVSLRSLDLLGVIDPETKSVVWASCGNWRCQHDPEFLPNGHLLLYDNFGSRLGTRIVEYNPQNQAATWFYPDAGAEPFITVHRGMKQHLGNGNTLIVDPEPGRLLEITADKKLVWQFNPVSEKRIVAGKTITDRQALTSAHRYRAQDLLFLKDRFQARP